MGLFTSIFGANSVLDDEKQATEDEKKRADDLRIKQSEERLALKTRSKTMRGGGRVGLMFGSNQQGVA